MSAEHKDAQDARLEMLSNRLFGEPAEVEPAEAEELLRAAGVDPTRLKSDLYQRMLERSESYARAGKPLPPLLSQALRDFQPIAEPVEGKLDRTARLIMTRLLEEIRELPKLLAAGTTPQFTAAYRNRKELSGRDLRVLDQAAEDLGRRVEERKMGERKTHE